MSFTTNVKNEISKQLSNKSANQAELAAILRNFYHQELNKLEILTENSTICKHIYTLFKELYNLNIKINYQTTKFSKNRLYNLIIPNNEELILKDLSVIDNDKNYLKTPSSYLLGCEDEKRAYLKGVFLITGSLNDPKTSMYHLEFFIDYIEEAEFLVNLLNEFFLNSKLIEREKGYMVYLKEAEKIGDFLRIINASRAVMYFEDIRIYRDHKNMTNRLNNCEQANIEKSMLTSSKQVEDINIIINTLGKENIDKKLVEIMDYRLKYQEASLQELSEIITYETGKSITKSGLNHRFRKIKEIATKIKNKQI